MDPKSSNLVARCRAALRRGLQRARPGTPIDTKGYVTEPADNLLSGVRLEDFEADLRQGDGNELETKFRAAHSSSALAVNVFSPFRSRPGDLALAGHSGLGLQQFERKLSAGIPGRRTPNLDLVAVGDNVIVAVESKCTEYLTGKEASFSEAYSQHIQDERRDSPWFAEMLSLKREPARYAQLDAAQLIKHAFGLGRPGAGLPDKRTLLYLYWEPANAAAFPEFVRHRAEVADFAGRINGGQPAFQASSYSSLWREWERVGASAWLKDHVARLRLRYDVEI